MIGLALAAAMLLTTTRLLAAGHVSLDASHRYYRDAAGHPKFLIGYYGWAAVPDGYFIDHPSRYAAMMTLGAPYRINYIRISLGVNRMTSRWNGEGRRTPVPFAYVNGKADLDRWDPVFWTGLRRQCELAHHKGVIVHISLFDGVELRPQGGAQFGYSNSFWNPANQVRQYYPDPDLNHDGGIEQNREFYQLDAFESSTGLGYYQKKLIDKAMAETRGDTNVFFEVGNELLSSPSTWNTAVIRYIRSRTHDPVSQCGGGRATNLMGWSQHSANTPAEVKANVASIVGRGYPAWEDPDGPALSDLNVSPDDLRRSAWYSFVGGGACWGGFTVDFWTGGPGFNAVKAGYYKNLEAFIDQSGVRFWEMAPAQNLVSHSEVNSCLARPGAAYLVYTLDDATVSLDLTGAAGTMKARSYDPKTGAWGKPLLVTGGGVRTFQKPDAAQDWVLYVAKANP